MATEKDIEIFRKEGELQKLNDCVEEIKQVLKLKKEKE